MKTEIEEGQSHCLRPRPFFEGGGAACSFGSSSGTTAATKASTTQISNFNVKLNRVSPQLPASLLSLPSSEIITKEKRNKQTFPAGCVSIQNIEK